MPTSADIRAYLNTRYDDNELNALCSDHFRPVYDDFADGMKKGQKIQLLLDYCERRGALPELHSALEGDRPEQYRTYFGAGGGGASAGYRLGTVLKEFTGRTKDIRRLVSYLSRGGGTAAIRGLGGIGKTVLALKVVHKLSGQYPDLQLMVELGFGGIPLPPEEVLGTVIHALRPEEKLPEGLAELQGIYRAVLAGKRGLLLLDNAAKPEQVLPLLSPVPKGWAVIVTSRSRFSLPDALLHDLGLLPLTDALTLLRRLLSKGARHDLAAADLEPLAERCGRLPLALRVAAGYLTTYADWTLADYAAALERARLKYLDAPGEASVQAVLGLSIDRLRERDALLAARWEQLAVFPAPFDRAAAAAVWGELGDVPAGDVDAWPALAPLDEEETRAGLSALVQQSLLEWDAASGTYALHDLLRECALAACAGESRRNPADCVTGSGQALDGARLRHAWHYLAVGSAANDLYEQGGAAAVRGGAAAPGGGVGNVGAANAAAGEGGYGGAVVGERVPQRGGLCAGPADGAAGEDRGAGGGGAGRGRPGGPARRGGASRQPGERVCGPGGGAAGDRVL